MIVVKAQIVTRPWGVDVEALPPFPKGSVRYIKCEPDPYNTDSLYLFYEPI